MKFLYRPYTCGGIPLRARVVSRFPSVPPTEIAVKPTAPEFMVALREEEGVAQKPAGQVAFLTPEQIDALQHTPGAHVNFNGSTGSFQVDGRRDESFTDTTVSIPTEMFSTGNRSSGGASSSGESSSDLADRIAREVLGDNAVGLGQSRLRPGQTPTSGSGSYYAPDGTLVTVKATETPAAPSPVLTPKKAAVVKTDVPAPAPGATEAPSSAPPPVAEVVLAPPPSPVETASVPGMARELVVQYSAISTPPPCVLSPGVRPTSFANEAERAAWIRANPACVLEGSLVPLAPKPVWPWIVGGMVLAGGIGAGAWYYSTRR